MAGIEMNHIPYKGTSQSLHDVITGRVPVMIDNLGPILPHIQSGALIAIGVSTAEPVPAAAGRAADRQRREGLPGELVECAVGAGQDAARDRRQAQRRSQRHPAASPR